MEIELIVSYGVSNMKISDSKNGAIFCLLMNHTSVYIQIPEEYAYGEGMYAERLVNVQGLQISKRLHHGLGRNNDEQKNRAHFG